MKTKLLASIMLLFWGGGLVAKTVVDLQKTPDGYTLDYEVPGWYLEQVNEMGLTSGSSTSGEVYSVACVPGYNYLGDVGKPQLPVLTFYMAVASPDKVPVFEVINTVTEYVSLTDKYFPAQIPWPKSRPLSERPFSINKDYYETEGEVQELASVTETFTIRGVIIICPYFQNFDTLQSKTDVLPFKYEQLTTDDHNWTVLSGPTPSRIDDPPDVTGPAADHTTGQDGNYIYTEASAADDGNPDKKFDFTTPKFNFKSLSNPLLTFYYHMFSDNAGEDHMGELYVDINVDGTWSNDVITISGNQGDAWKEQKLDLKPYKGDRVIFRIRGVTGDSWESDISIDDFRIDEDPTGIGDIVTHVYSTFDLKLFGSRVYYQVPKNAGSNPVRIALYNAQGKLVKTLLNKSVSAGHYYMPVGNVAAGIYILKMETKGFNKTRNVILTK